MTINVTVTVGPWVGDNRVEVLHRTKTGSETLLATLKENEARHTVVFEGQDIVVREVKAKKEVSNG